MKTADNEGRAARHLVEALAGFENNAATFDESLDSETLRECATEILPHVGGDPRTLFGRHRGKRQSEIGERALLPAQARRNQTPEFSGQPRRRFQRQGERAGSRQP